MNQCSYEMKCITPLYSHGHSTEEPEFRLTEIKALMRFTFRAVKRYDSMTRLYLEEGELFGYASREKALASSIRLRLDAENNKDISILESKLLFHNKKEHNRDVKYIACDSHYKIDIMTFNDGVMEQYQQWFELSLVLFGIGGRARRARGSFSFSCNHIKLDNSKIFMKSLWQLLNQLSEDSSEFMMESNCIKRKECGKQDYPYIKSIKLGRKSVGWKELLRKIDTSSHENNSEYSGYVNFDTKEKYASPICVSAIQLKDGLYPIITVLNEKKDITEKDKKIGEKFIRQILDE